MANKKRARKLTDKELVRTLFSKDVRKQLKEVLAEPSGEKRKRRRSKQT